MPPRPPPPAPAGCAAMSNVAPTTISELPGLELCRSIAKTFFPSTRNPEPSMDAICKSFFSSLNGTLLVALVFQLTSSGYAGRRTLVISCPLIQKRAPSSRIASIFIIDPIGSSLKSNSFLK